MKIFYSRRNNGRPAAFLDRDGTLNRNRHGEYVTRPDQFSLYSCTIKALKLLTDKGYQIIVLSNHSGIGRGYMTLETAKEINGMLAEQLIQAGVALSGIYICPHLPSAGCVCRKPSDGLLKEALKDTRTDMSRSFVAGDSSGDLKLAEAAGIPGFLVLTGAGLRTLKKNSGVRKFGTLLSLAKAMPCVN